MLLRKLVDSISCLHEKQTQQILSCYEVLEYSLKVNHYFDQI